MTRSDLPNELAALEKAMATCPPLASELTRQRVLARVRTELSADNKRSFWQFAAAVAAGFLLMLNVGLSAAKSSLPPSLARDGQAVQELCGQLQELNLGLTKEDIRRQCVLLAAGSNLIPMGTPRGSLGTLPKAAAQ